MSEQLPSTLHNKVGSDILIIAFSALQGTPKPHFEFKNLLAENKQYDALLVRDTHDLWFQKGTSELGANIDDMAKYLQRFRQQYRKVVMVGASMGGYVGAILSQLIKADAAIVISGQSFIDTTNRRKYNDMRWEDRMWRINKECDKKYFDLQFSFRKLGKPIIPIYWFYGEFHKLDRIHALRMAEFVGVKIFEILGTDHYAGLALKGQGILQSIIEDVIQGVELRASSGRFLTTVKE